MTFKRLQDDVIDLCQELQKNTDLTITKIKNVINRGYYDFVKQTYAITNTIDITSVADKISYTSSDAANLAYVYKPYQVRWIQSGVTERGKVLQPFPGGHANLPQRYEYGIPSHYVITQVHTRGNIALQTYPIDSASGNTIRVYAFMFPTADLSGATDQPLIKEAWQDALVKYAVWQLFSQYGHTNPAFRAKSLEYKSFYMEDVEIAKESMFTESMDDYPEIIDVYNTYGD